MTTTEASCFPSFTRHEALEIAGELLCAAHDSQTSDPARAARLTGWAHRIQRHAFAVRPLIYRVGPVDPVIEFDNVGALVRDYQTDTPAELRELADRDAHDFATRVRHAWEPAR